MSRDRALSPAQQRGWASDGYLLLKEVLPKTTIAALIREIDRLHRREIRRNRDPNTRPGMDRRNILPDSQVFIDLIDHPATFGPVIELMGPYIQLSMAEAVVRPPNPDDKGFIHTDGGQALRRIRVSETSWPLQLKVQYFLTDLRKPRQRQLHPVPRQPPAPLSRRGHPGHHRHAGRRAALRRGRGRGRLSPLALARRVDQPLPPRPQDPDLLLQPDVLPHVRLQRPRPGGARPLHAPAAPPARRPRQGVATGAYFYSPEDQVEVIEEPA